ncbi:MAG: anaerobic ribonucleoside-triphosphate reductase, partial [Ruthenibacterium sp.]
MIKNIIKRDGRVVLYDENKIAAAILKSLAAAGVGDAATAKQIADAVQENLTAACKTAPPQIEQIQDAVEKSLMSAGFADAAKQYILYRANRTRIREANTSLMKAIDEITNVDARESDMKRDNANIDGNTAMGSMLQIGTAGAKAYNAAYLLTSAQAKAHTEGDIHIHDFDFYALTTTCCQIDLISLFKGGFSTGHGYLREPQSIASYAALAAIAIQSNQNDQHGGQGVPNFDYAMADGVRKTFSKVYARKLQEVLEDHLETDDEKELATRAIAAGEQATGAAVRMGEDIEAFDAAVIKELFESSRIDNATAAHLVSNVRRRALQQTDRETYQAMEGFVHNLNTMHSRAGAQTPFSSINYGTDTTPEGRMAIRNILNATDAGLGHGETAIFPIHIFKVKEGVNYFPDDPNFDLFEQSCKVSAKRLFPNYVFLDSPFNLQYYKAGQPETEVATMGCRTRV